MAIKFVYKVCEECRYLFEVEWGSMDLPTVLGYTPSDWSETAWTFEIPHNGGPVKDGCNASLVVFREEF